MIECLIGLQPESADGTYRGGMQMQRPSYINLNRDLPFLYKPIQLFIYLISFVMIL